MSSSKHQWVVISTLQYKIVFRLELKFTEDAYGDLKLFKIFKLLLFKTCIPLMIMGYYPVIKKQWRFTVDKTKSSTMVLMAMCR